LTLPSCQVKAASIVCSAARSLELCLIPENTAFYPLYPAYRTISVSKCGWLQKGLRSTCRASLPASVQPIGIKNP
jgi:hypothetical protein